MCDSRPEVLEDYLRKKASLKGGCTMVTWKAVAFGNGLFPLDTRVSGCPHWLAEVSNAPKSVLPLNCLSVVTTVKALRCLHGSQKSSALKGWWPLGCQPLSFVCFPQRTLVLSVCILFYCAVGDEGRDARALLWAGRCVQG